MQLDEKTRNEIASAIQKYHMHVGQFIDKMSILEAVITSIVAIHFSTDQAKRDSLYMNVVGKLNINSKKKLFQQIMEESYSEISKNYESEIQSVQKLIERRNILAHSYVDENSQHIIDHKYWVIPIVHLSSKNMSNKMDIKLKEQKELYNLSVEIVDKFFDIRNEVQDANTKQRT